MRVCVSILSTKDIYIDTLWKPKRNFEMSIKI